MQHWVVGGLASRPRRLEVLPGTEEQGLYFRV